MKEKTAPKIYFEQSSSDLTGLHAYNSLTTETSRKKMKVVFHDFGFLQNHFYFCSPFIFVGGEVLIEPRYHAWVQTVPRGGIGYCERPLILKLYARLSPSEEMYPGLSPSLIHIFHINLY